MIFAYSPPMIISIIVPNTTNLTYANDSFMDKPYALPQYL
ncbi:Uncharacterised protein [uncultured archaeon]|nr:Uncharacterised protein [uncultured archaeon]